jgi:hypothetical protein
MHLIQFQNPTPSPTTQLSKLCEKSGQLICGLQYENITILLEVYTTLSIGTYRLFYIYETTLHD